MNALLDAFWEATDLAVHKPASASVHCWKHALPINPISEDSLFDERRRSVPVATGVLPRVLRAPY